VWFLEVALRKHISEEGLDVVHLFSTMYYRCVVPLAMRTTKMWEYTGITDPDWVSTAVVTNVEVWSWLYMVLKVGNQQTVSGPQAFNKEHPPDLVSFFPSPSSCWSSGAQPAPDLSLFF
jgi:hypothetical protein